MSDSSHPELSSQESIADRFYSRALDRIRLYMFVIAALATVGAFWKFGVRCAVGLALGSAIAFVNFYWLKRAISGFADRAAGATSSQSGSGIVARFLLRYVLIALGACAILTVSPASLNGLLAGLFLPAAAILCEAAYELYAALPRGI
jgi:hypothetical protein